MSTTTPSAAPHVAADPRTEHDVLRWLAANRPESRQMLVLNPSTPPSLLQSLAALDDDSVRAAIAVRSALYIPQDADQGLAADPATSTESLWSVAQSRPDVRPLVAMNPSASRWLLQWLSTQDDSLIQAALAVRYAKEVAAAPPRTDVATYSRTAVASSTPGWAPSGEPARVEVVYPDGRRAPLHTQPMSAPTNGMAVASLVTGLLGISVIAVILGHSAMSQIKRTGERGEGMATAGLLLGYLGVLISIALISSIFGARSNLGAYS